MTMDRPSDFQSPAIAGNLASAGGTTSTVELKKQKNNSQIRFYAVKAGHKPGVYLNWKECEENITRYKNACFKSFGTLAEANAYIAGNEPLETSISSNTLVSRFYGVAKGRVPGVYTDWATAEKQIKGWKGGPKYKKFTTCAEAEAFVRQYGDTRMEEAPALSTNEIDSDKRTIAEVEEDEVATIRDTKRAKRSGPDREVAGALVDVNEPDMLELNQDTGTSSVAENATQSSVIRIWTDGSSRGNGKVGAMAGLGVHFGNADSRNVAERLPGEPQTNQRAELAAILRALEIAPKHRDVQIRTDSQYSINCVTVWYKNWERNSWQTSSKKPVLNRDLIQDILTKTREREAIGSKTEFVWVKGHATEPGNIAADRLAVMGAQMQQV